MKLKTLKDLWGVVEDTDMHDWVSVQKLRQEAIKWVKSGNLGDEDWMEFFNITENDLKGGVK